ncbi:hypothetical protein B4N89_03265 [Embleya scabrispora]|uniref:Uncharacterized protein n=1 Tax=Embleya scabrispora TaxID=159449 RepID=A0A1T3NTT2_9ACTN|nr:hypothetical protein [Embleya scabrispora]OPC80100.1 hypothetical protein B4N89_03265 [Embleya scabrispora]
MAPTVVRPAPGTRPASTPTRPRRPLRRFAPASVAEAARRSAYAFLALPLGLIGIVLTLGGRSSRAARLQLAAARRFLDPHTGGEHHSGATTDRGAAVPGAVRVLRHAVLDTALGVPMPALAAYAYGNTIRNLTYPIWYGDSDYHDAWGGPSLAGVWAVHAVGGLAFFAVCLCLIQGLTNLRAAGARRTFRTESRA